jgi:hypothetical protein
MKREWKTVSEDLAKVARAWGITVKTNVYHVSYANGSSMQCQSHKAWMTEGEEEALYDSVCP